MLKIAHCIKDEEKYIILRVDGDFIDVGPLFLLAQSRKRVKDFMYVNATRKNYVDSVSLEIKESPIRLVDSYKYYHKLIVKTLLCAIDILDFEHAIASVWGADTLPMLPDYEFKSATLGLSMYDTCGKRTMVSVQIIQRNVDGYYNLTRTLRDVREGTTKTSTSIIKNRTTLYKRLYATNHSVDDIKKTNAGLATKTEKKERDANVRALISTYVDTSNTTETWVDKNVFFSSLIDCSIDAHTLMVELMSTLIFGGDVVDREKHIVESRCISYEYIHGEVKEKIQEDLHSQTQRAKNLQSENAIKVRDLQKMTRLIDIHSKSIKDS